MFSEHAFSLFYSRMERSRMFAFRACYWLWVISFLGSVITEGESILVVLVGIFQEARCMKP